MTFFPNFYIGRYLKTQIAFCGQSKCEKFAHFALHTNVIRWELGPCEAICVVTLMSYTFCVFRYLPLMSPSSYRAAAPKRDDEFAYRTDELGTALRAVPNRVEKGTKRNSQI